MGRKRVSLGNDTVRGIDVSHYQPRIDWVKVKASGVEFAIIKASEGTTNKDKLHKSHTTNARAAGVLVGSYHFLHYRSDPIVQAKNFLAAIGEHKKGDLPPVADIEWADGITKMNFQTADLALAFLEEVEKKAGITPIIYTAASFFDGAPKPERFKRFPLWVANYRVKAPMVPSPWDSFAIWQYTDKAAVPGAGAVDGNLFNGTLAQLHALTKQ